MRYLEVMSVLDRRLGSVYSEDWLSRNLHKGNKFSKLHFHWNDPSNWYDKLQIPALVRMGIGLDRQHINRLLRKSAPGKHNVNNRDNYFHGAWLLRKRLITLSEGKKGQKIATLSRPCQLAKYSHCHFVVKNGPLIFFVSFEEYPN